MSMDPLLLRARGLWEGLARVPASFMPTDDANVVVSPRSGLCPTGWVGAVVLEGSAIVTVPAESTVLIVREALRRLSVEAIVDGASIRGDCLLRGCSARQRCRTPPQKASAHWTPTHC